MLLIKMMEEISVEYIDMDILENGFLPAIKLGSIKILKTILEKFLIENEGNDLSDPKNLKKW